jgi:hypothetical protein
MLKLDIALPPPRGQEIIELGVAAKNGPSHLRR